MDSGMKDDRAVSSDGIDAMVAQTRAEWARRRPAQVRWAQWLMYAGAALAVVRQVTIWAGAERGPGDPSLLVGALLWGGVVAALWLVLAGCVGAGMSWARWVVSVLAVFTLVTTLSWLIWPVVAPTATDLLLTVPEIGISVGVLVLMWVRPARDFFRTESPTG